MENNKNELLNLLYEKYGTVVNKRELAEILKLSEPSIDSLVQENKIVYMKKDEKRHSKVSFIISDVVDYMFKNRSLPKKG